MPSDMDMFFEPDTKTFTAVSTDHPVEVETAQGQPTKTDQIASFFVSGFDEPEPPGEEETSTGETAAKEGEKKDETTVAEAPRIDGRLIQQAISLGMHPAEAQSYGSPDVLRAVLADRARRISPESVKSRSREAANVEEQETPLPELELKIEDDADPEIKKMAESFKTYAKKLNEHAATRIKSLQNDLEEIRGEHKQRSEREARSLQDNITNAFDEEVASWGDEFKELVGKPSEAIVAHGTAQAREAGRLNEFVVQMQAGYAALHGAPTPEEAVRLTKEFLRQGRAALWPEKAASKAKKEVAENLRKQKGGVGLRPGRGRHTEIPEQGDGAAMAAIGTFMADQGIVNPWQVRRAS